MVRHPARMPKKPTRKRPADLNQLAAAIVAEVAEATEERPGKNPAAVALGRLGGLKGGKARAEKLSKKKRSDIAKKAARARWGKTSD